MNTCETTQPKLCDALSQLKGEMPPVFAGTRLDRFTGFGYRWRTLQNEKSRGETPASMFLEAGRRKTLLVRDRFLDYWQRKLDAANRR